MNYKILRLAVIGCGAVFEQFYVPALKKLGWIPNLLIDNNLERSKLMAKKIKSKPVDNYINYYDDFDVAIILVPPKFHKQISIDLICQNKHILVEKPFSINYADSISMIEKSVAYNTILLISLYRRFTYTANWLKSIFSSGFQKEIVKFEVVEGYVFSWPAETNSYWSKKITGGGVLIDMGAHSLDLLCWWLGNFRVVEYKDDSYGGVEAESFIKLETDNGLSGTVELSRTRNLGSFVKFYTDEGYLLVGLTNNLIETNIPKFQNLKYNNYNIFKFPNQSYTDLFKMQLQDWYKSITVTGKTIFKDDSAARSMEIIDYCYNNKSTWKLPWLEPYKNE